MDPSSSDRKVHFAEPPPEQAEGGLEQAMATLAGYFSAQGHEVCRNAGLHDLWQNRPDVVHFHGLWQPAHAVLSLYCRWNGIPYIVSPHGMLEPWAWQHKHYKKRPYFHLIERYHINGAGLVLTTSTQEADNLKDFDLQARVEMIPLPIAEQRTPDYAAAREELGWRDDTRVLLYLSRVHPKKGLHLLLEALTQLSADLQSMLRLVVVGDGPRRYVERLRRYAAAHAAQLPAIDWEGAVWGDRKWRFLQGADLFCLPTFSENFGIVVLEALQVGTPVLTTHATPWQFVDAWNAGMVVAPDVDALATALRTWDGDRGSARGRHVLAARAHDTFDIDVLGERYADAYHSVVSQQDPTHL